MQVEAFNNRLDYDTVASWWKDYGMEPIDIRHLGHGFIIRGYAAVFIYPTGTPICLLENLVSNKHLNKADRNEAVDLLLKTVFKLLRMKGIERVHSITSWDFVTDRALKHGFETNDKQYKILYKNI